MVTSLAAFSQKYKIFSLRAVVYLYYFLKGEQ